MPWKPCSVCTGTTIRWWAVRPPISGSATCSRCTWLPPPGGYFKASSIAWASHDGAVPLEGAGG